MMEHENRIKSGHVKIRHVAAVAGQRVHRVVDALEVVVVLSTVLEHLVGKDGVVGLGAQELVRAGTEPAEESVNQSVQMLQLLSYLEDLPGGVGRHQLLNPVHPALTVRVRRADGVGVVCELRNQHKILFSSRNYIDSPGYHSGYLSPRARDGIYNYTTDYPPAAVPMAC